MLKNTHIEFSLTLTLLFILLTFFFSSLFGGGVFPIFPFLLLPILAVLPDSDHPESYLNKKIPFLKGLSKLGAHRTWSHDLVTIFFITCLLYFCFGKAFGHFDVSFVAPEGIEGFKKLWFYAKTAITSPNFVGIYIVLFGHILGDFLTKGQIKFFYWSELIIKKMGKNNILKYTIGLPFLILSKLQTLLNKIKSNIFPLTGSGVELKLYAGLFNFTNIILIGLLFFVLGSTNEIESSIYLLNGGEGTLKLSRLILVISFFTVSLLYFFNINMGKLKQYIKMSKGIILFSISTVAIIILSFLGYQLIPQLANYGIGIIIIDFFIVVFLYRKFIKMGIEDFNIILNEIILVIIYCILTFSFIKYTIVEPKLNDQDQEGASKIMNIVNKTTDFAKDKNKKNNNNDNKANN